MKKKIFLFISIVFSFSKTYSQCIYNENESKAYLINNIKKLNQIEGIWNLESKKYIKNAYGNIENVKNATLKVAIIKSGNVYKLCYLDDPDNDIVEFVPTASNDLYIYQKTFTQDKSYYKLSANANVSNGYYLEYTLDITEKLHKDYKRDNGRDSYDNNTLLNSIKGVKIFPTNNDYNIAKQEEIVKNSISSGTGFALTNDGLVVTNHHVIENGTSIKIKGINGDFTKAYNAVVIQKDPIMDIAILKITDPFFKLNNKIPYLINRSTKDVGEAINVLGFPLTATMGEEIKYTNGTISSKSGYQGEISCYQISAPVQPGNSGGPLFDSNGNIIGIISSKHRDAENASYAIKSSYLLNTAESMPSSPKLNTINTMSKLSIQDKIKLIKNFVYIIEVKYN